MILRKKRLRNYLYPGANVVNLVFPNFEEGEPSGSKDVEPVVASTPDAIDLPVTPSPKAIDDTGIAYITDLQAHCVLVMDLEKEELIAIIPLPEESRPDEIAVSPDHKFVYVTSDKKKEVYVIQTATNRRVFYYSNQRTAYIHSSSTGFKGRIGGYRRRCWFGSYRSIQLSGLAPNKHDPNQWRTWRNCSWTKCLCLPK